MPFHKSSTDTYYPNIQPPFYAAPYHSSSPPPPAPSAPSVPTAPTEPAPTPLYLAESLVPSTTHAVPPSRKLLILDLNGTLLFRPPHPPFKRAKPGPYQQPQPALRTVHPRPYMRALRAYLFAPPTLAWLDAMVWSSAQPHSVDDMVARCFGPDRAHLAAVWARDTLGLSKDTYHLKTLTTKDLAKPWAELLPAAPERHSPRTTLLLDDSARKARLQPWNHLCVAEYTARTRARDLAVLAAETQTQKKRKKRRNVAAAGANADAGAADAPGYDETLLSVIGVLDALKQESNVAGWIRAGGLWGPAGARSAPSLDPSLGPNTDPADTNAKRKRGGNDDAGASASNGDGSNGGGSGGMWFEDAPTMAYWAGRGRAALDELGVGVGDGAGAIDR